MPPIALITGSNQGIGRATAEALAINHGFHVITTSRNLAAGETVASSLRENGYKAVAIQLDLTSEESVKAAVAFVEKEFGGLDVLINNAGILIDVQKDLPPWELYNRTFITNVIGPGVLTELFIPLLREAPSGLPRIIFLTSSMGSLHYATDKSLPWYSIDYKVYDASKAAVNMLMLNFARVLEEDNGVGRVNAVCPGYVNSNLTRFDQSGASVEMGARRVVEVAVDDREDGPHRTFSNADGELPW